MSFSFELLLFVLSFVTGVVTLLDVLVWRKRRVQHVLTPSSVGQPLGGQNASSTVPPQPAVAHTSVKTPWWIEYSISFFPVILFVFMLRSFVVEPFRIPTGSMIPTLEVGDLILVNKFAYGIRLPVLKTKVIEVGEPKRGDVMVFRFPVDPSLDYIKRIVGVPGDRIEYRDKRLTINGQLASLQPLGDYFLADRAEYVQTFSEDLVGVKHRILINQDEANPPRPRFRFNYYDACQYTEDSLSCVVPAGHYFMMGDNRDSSEDSRFWGFVPEANIVGKAFFVWMNFSDLKRIGKFQ